MQPVSKQWIDKHEPATLGLLLLEMVFSIRSVQRGCKREEIALHDLHPTGAGSSFPEGKAAGA
jgi:hypothetical protein